MVHRPTDDRLAEQSYHHTQIKLPCICLALGNIGDSPGFWFKRQKIPFQMITHANR